MLERSTLMSGVLQDSPAVQMATEQLLAFEARADAGADFNTDSRKGAHRAAEKKRRDAINEGINRLASLLPGEEKNKSTILKNAAELLETLQSGQTLVETALRSKITRLEAE
jgi:hypothetical protein